MAHDRRLKVLLFVFGVASIVTGAALADVYLSSYGTAYGGEYGVVDGPVVELGGSYEIQSGNPTTADSVNISTKSNGYVNFSSSGRTNATVDQLTGTWTNVSELNVTQHALTIDPSDKLAATVEGDTDSLSFQGSMAVDDETADVVYTGASGTTNLTLRGLPVTTTIAAINATTNDVLGVATTDVAGTITFTDLPNSKHIVQLQTSSGGPNITSTSPADGHDATTSSVTLEATVNDTDFPNDNVTVEIYANSSLVHTDHITTNGTVSTTVTLALGKQHTWHVEAEDAYGQQTSSATFTINTPANITFREETNPDQVIDDEDINVTVYYGDEVDTQLVTDGTYNLTALPPDEPIVIRANATNHTVRTLILETIYDQQSMYLLNDTVPTYLVRFDLEDPTGDFPRDETALFVERDLNQSGSVEWRTIAGDYFGVKGVPVYLKQEERYRLKIKNLNTSDVVVINPYTAIQSETVTVSAGSATVDIPTAERAYGWNVTMNETGQYILVQYDDTEDQTQSIKVTIHERFNTSNVLVNNNTFSTNQLMYQVALTNAQANTTWMAELYIDRGSGYQHFRVPISSGPSTLIPVNLDAVWVQAIGVFIMLVVALAFSQLNQGVGAITTSLVGGLLWWIGLLSGTATGATIVIALGISVVFHYQQRGRAA